ncbi:hypothetical protein GCM10027347_53750 [Larkinella harenae]
MTFFFIVVFLSVLFIQQVLPLQWTLFGFVVTLLFFYYTSKISALWLNISNEKFSRKLLYTAFAIRLFWVVLSYFYFIWSTGKPFEFLTADALGYHNEAIWLVGLLRDGKFDLYLNYIGSNYADMGYPFYLGILYYLFGDGVIVPRILKAALSSYTCLLVYYIGRNNFNESVGRMAGVLTMLVPNLIYYCGIHVKETEMVFLTVCFIYLADRFIREPTVYFGTVAGLILAGGSLFFFRTVLAGCLIGSVAMATFLTSSRISTRNKRFLLIMLLVMVVFLIYSTSLGQRIDEYWTTGDQNLTSQMDNFATRQGANRLARYGSKSLFLPIMLIAPFPTLVNIPEQQNAMMLGGPIFTRNVYAFFVIIGLWALYKQKKIREHILLLAVLFSYIFVLASSGFALSERFHLPLIPFLLILAAYGVSQLNQRNKKYYVPYLFLVSVIIIGWNWFKLAGRS